MSFKKQPGTSEDFDFDSAVCNLFPEYVAHGGDHLCSGLHNAHPEIISAVVAHRGYRLYGVHRDHLGGVMHTVEMISAVCCTPRRLSQWCATHPGDDLRGVHTAEIISAVCCTPRRKLCDRISRGYRNQIRKYFSLFISCPDGFES